MMAKKAWKDRWEVWVDLFEVCFVLFLCIFGGNGGVKRASKRSQRMFLKAFKDIWEACLHLFDAFVHVWKAWKEAFGWDIVCIGEREKEGMYLFVMIPLFKTSRTCCCQYVISSHKDNTK
ncbi:hypothetical protein QBC41DRAFT_320732 [Cercophora samala]|uniref:Uncharacterized protein n=1 Tax=Cercophora samala TaxID=330535 RepID=A0AA39ZDJ9_9PEZI|nr:hypothetical protein QBC41DRAFT_320732 [Cercophora samala]